MRMRWNRLPARACLHAACSPCRWPAARRLQPAGAAAAQPPQATAPPCQRSPPPQPAAPAPPPPTAEQQRVRVLIAQVEAAYAGGDADYRKGMLAEAKIEFDRAVDLMLSSGIDIKADPQLQDEFDKHRRPGERAGDGGAQAGQRLCAQGRDHARRGRQRRHLRRRSQPGGQGHGRSGHHQIRPAADGQRLRGRLHQLLRQHAKGPQYAAALLRALAAATRR